MDELWGVFCEDFGENLSCYNSTALYQVLFHDALHPCCVLLWPRVPMVPLTARPSLTNWCVLFSFIEHVEINSFRPRKHIATILQMKVFKHIFLNEKLRVRFKFYWFFFFRKSMIDNKAAFIQYWLGAVKKHKPLSEPILTNILVLNHVIIGSGKCFVVFHDFIWCPWVIWSWYL